MENSSHKYIPEIDIVRAAAFLMVAIVHVSVPTWVNGIPDPSLFEQLILSVIKTGWIGVPLFLFVSGYSLAINKTAPGYRLNVKQFFLNRFLRIFPIWITCLLILKWSHKLSGGNFLSLLLLNTQDLPAANAFNISWSIQLEFFCYFLFPMFLSFVNDRKQLFLIFSTLLAFRLLVCFVPTQMVWELSYANVFGAGTIFLSGMLARTFMESQTPLKAKILPYASWITALGIALFIGMVHFIAKNGGYQTASGKMMNVFFAVLPEISSVIFALITVPYFLKGAARIHPLRLIPKIFAHIGMVSYSAYMFSLFIHDFIAKVLPYFGLFQPGGWIMYGVFLSLYLATLIAFSTLTYYTIEKPFLSKRKKY